VPEAIAFLVRFILYAGVLAAAGGGLSAASLKPHPASAAGERWMRAGALSGLAAACAGAILQPLRLGAGLDPEVWLIALASPPGQAAGLHAAGLLLIFAGARASGAAGAAMRLSGAGIALSGFAVSGHAAAAGWLPAGLLLAHVVLAAWWLGALMLLEKSCGEGPGPNTQAALRTFTRQATALVVLLAAAGAFLLGDLLDFEAGRLLSPYGAAIGAKLLAVLAVLALVARNRFILTPKLLAGETEASAAMARTIRAEIRLLLLVLAATAALTTWTSPNV